MQPSEKQIVNDLLHLVLEQNNILRHHNEIYKTVITELDKQYKVLETQVERLKDRITKINDDIKKQP